MESSFASCCSRWKPFQIAWVQKEGKPRRWTESNSQKSMRTEGGREGRRNVRNRHLKTSVEKQRDSQTLRYYQAHSAQSTAMTRSAISTIWRPLKSFLVRLTFLFGIVTTFVQLKSKATEWNCRRRRWMPPLQLLTRRARRSPASPTCASAAPSRGPLLARLPAPPIRSSGSRPRGPIGCSNILNFTRARPPQRTR